MLIWSSPRGTSLQVPSGILRAGDFATASDALTILEQAQDERDHLAAQARQDAAVLLARARAEAEQLRADAAAEAVDLVAQTTAQATEEFVRRWHAQLADLQASSEAAMARMERRLAAIVTTAVQRMVMAEPREAVMRRAVLTLRDTMSEARAARLHVHPDDVDAARAALSVIDGDPDAPRVQIEADPSIAPGSSVFETDMGRLDTSLGVQLDGLRSALEGAVRIALYERVGAAPAAGASAEDGGPGTPARSAAH